MKESESPKSPKRPKTPDAIRERMEGTYEWLKILRSEYTDDPEWQHINQKTLSPEEIAERIVILASFFPMRHTPDDEQRHQKLAKIKKEYWFKLSPSEQEIITRGGFDYHEDMVAGIYPHIIYMLLWCICEVDEIALTDKMHYYPELYPRLEAIVENPEKLTESPRLRPIDEILDAMIETYRLYMLSKFAFDAEEEDMPENTNFLFVAAWYIALLWATDEGPWDEILYELYEDAFMITGREKDGNYEAWDKQMEDEVDWDNMSQEGMEVEDVGGGIVRIRLVDDDAKMKKIPKDKTEE